MRAKKPTVGSVFTIPTGDGRVGVGQVVAIYLKEALFLAVFAPVVEDSAVPVKLQEALAGEVQFLALSFDAKLHVGDWTIVGRFPVREDIPFPAYKEAVTTWDHVDVVDYSGLRRRRATREEAESLPNRAFVSPIRLEKALRATLGLEPWSDAYDALRPPLVTSQQVFGAGPKL